MRNIRNFDSEGSFGVWRPEKNCADINVQLPLYPRTLGYYVRKAGMEETAPAGSKNFVECFWGVEGKGECYRGETPDKKVSLLGPECFFYRLPGEPHHFVAKTKIWRYWWFTFDGPAAQAVMEGYAYPRDCFWAGPCPEVLFGELKQRLWNRTPYDWRMAFAVIVRILAAAGGSNLEKNEQSLVRDAIAFCHDQLSNPELSVNMVAQNLGIERSTLFRVFKREMQVTPSEYIGQIRLQAALSLLDEHQRTVKDVARQCGFSDANYFCRFFKKNTGKTATAHNS